jgi:hypothetical protein
MRLAPVAFHPDVAAATAGPVTVDPAGVGMWGLGVISGDPDVAVTVPAVIATVPGPVAMCWGWWRDRFYGTGWGWAYANDYLGLSDACSEQETTGGSEEDFLHRAISLYFVL